MLIKIKRWWLARQQKAIAAEMLAVANARVYLTCQEKFLMRYAAKLAVQEVDLNINARRANRDRAAS